MSWMRSGTYLSQFLRDFLPALTASERFFEKKGEDIDERFSCWIPLLRTSPVKCALKKSVKLGKFEILRILVT